MQNGIPWWYFHKHGGAYEGTPVRSADPDGSIARLIDANRVIGSVVYPAATLEAPGVVHVVEGRRSRSVSRRLDLTARSGDLGGVQSRGIQGAGDRRHSQRDLAQALGQSELQSHQRADALDAVGLLTFPLTRQLSIDMMREAEAVANKLGITFRVGIDKRIAGAEKVGEHKTSMLQDVEAGRAMEIEALVGAVVELGRLTETPTPHIDAVYALVSLLAKQIADTRGKLSLGASTATATSTTVQTA